MNKTHLMVGLVLLSSFFTLQASARDSLRTDTNGVISRDEEGETQKPPYVYRTHRQPPPVYYEYIPPAPDVEYYLPLDDYVPHHKPRPKPLSGKKRKPPTHP